MSLTSHRGFNVSSDLRGDQVRFADGHGHYGGSPYDEVYGESYNEFDYLTIVQSTAPCDCSAVSSSSPRRTTARISTDRPPRQGR